jgi:Cu/Ag efflux pump CusA
LTKTLPNHFIIIIIIFFFFLKSLRANSFIMF